MKKILAACLLTLVTFGCNQQPEPFKAHVEHAEDPNTDSIEYLGEYRLGEGMNQIIVSVYKVSINGKMREVHWSKGGSIGVCDLDD